MNFVPYGSSGQGEEKNKDFDLKLDRIYKYWCHPVHRLKKDDTIRTIETVKEQKYRRHGENSTIVSVNDVEEGDVIVYKYYGLWHEAVVIGKPKKKYDKEEELNIIHYGKDPSSFSRKVMVDNLQISGKKQIKLKEFKGYYIYPNSVTVTRAMSRKGERRFSIFGNTSSDFVHWCKVIQVPSVFSIQSAATNELTQVVVIPHIGTVDEESFHKNWIKTEEELIIGSIIKIRGDIGILTSFQSNEIKLSCFDAIKQKVVSNQHHIDFKKTKQCIWIYWCNPSKCNRQHIILNKSFECLGKQDKIPAVTSAWEFCKWCVLRKYTESFYKKMITDYKGVTKGSILKVQGHLGMFYESNKDQQLWYYEGGKVVNKIELDLQKQTNDCWIYWSNANAFYTGDDIIERASDIGKYECPAALSEWEFCKWCVLVECEESFHKKLKREREIIKGSFLKVGGRFGIATYTKDGETKLAYYNTTVKIVEFEKIDLEKVIWIYLCNSNKRYTIDDIIERVSDRELYKLPDFQTEWEYCKWCVLLEYTDSFYKNLIKPGEELIKGSIIKVGSQSGILKSTKGNKFELIYYNESKNAVEIEQFDLPTDKEMYWIYWFNSSTCFTREDIIERALDRTKFEIPNFTSAWEFCKWCVLIGYAESFYKKYTKTSDELTKGSILKVRGHFGILKSIKKNKIEMMCYNQSQNAVFSKEFDLRKENQELIWVYWCNSSRCHLLDDIIERAFDRGKYEIPAFKTDWEFCIWCVLIGNAEQFTKKRIKQEEKINSGSILKVKGQFGIVTSITNTKIDLLCYNQRQMAVNSKTFDFKRNNEDILIYHCNLNTCHTSIDIIERATNWKKYTIQAFKSDWEFCKWCVLLGYAETFCEISIQPSKGSFLEVEGQLGILTSITNNTIKLLCYDKSEKKFDLQKLFEKGSWIYQCNQDICHSSDDIIKRVDAWKKDKIQVFKSDWELYNGFVLIGYRESFRKVIMTEITDLTKGSILKVKGQFGILTSITNNSIVLACYNQNKKAAVNTPFVLDIDNKEPIWIYWCSSSKCHTPDDIIERTSNSQKYKIQSLISEWEFCEWCVLLGYTDLFDKKSILRSDIPSKGSVLEVEGQLGILKSISHNQIEIMYYDKTEMKFDFQKLFEDGSWIYRCNSNSCHLPDDIIKRVDAWKKDKIPNFKFEWQFYKWCVLIGYPESFQKRLMTEISELNIGSIINIRGHFGILTHFSNRSIEIARYDQIKENVVYEGYCLDPDKNEPLWIYWCNSSKCHTPDDIIERTSDSPKNFKSEWDFCEWCVLYGYTELFYKRSVPIRAMPSKGSVLEVEGQLGILKSKTDNKIELMCYDKTEKKFDLQKPYKGSWIYKCNPNICHLSDDIIKRADAWKKDQIQTFKSEWEFYKWCVLIGYPESFEKALKTDTTELNIGSIINIRGQFGILKSFSNRTIVIAFYDKNKKAVVYHGYCLDPDEKEPLWIYWCNSRKCHTPDEIIERASNRRMHKLQTFRSEWDFCEWCVLNKYTESFYKKSIQPSIGSILKVEGQLGIVTSIKDNKIQCICYDKKEKEFDLQKIFEKGSWIYQCNQDICHSSDDIIKRVNAWKADEIQVFKSEWELFKWCVLIGYRESFQKRLITEISELTIGSILKIKGDFGIVKFIKNRSIVLAYRKQNKEYSKSLTLDKDDKNPIWIYWCNSSKCHTPDDIIERTSASRKNFKSEWDFCEWCVLLGYTESFNKSLVTERDELTVGSILKVKGQFGILKCITKKNIELMCYIQSQHDVTNKEFDLNKEINEGILKYWCNSSSCHTVGDIDERATDRKKYKNPVFTSEWEFCEWCVLIGNAKPFYKYLMSKSNSLIKGSILKVGYQFGILNSIEGNKIDILCYDRNADTKHVCNKIIDLKKVNKKLIWIYWCNSNTCYTGDSIIQRATDMKMYDILPCTSEWDFCTSCVLRKMSP